MLSEYVHIMKMMAEWEGKAYLASLNIPKKEKSIVPRYCLEMKDWIPRNKNMLIDVDERERPPPN